MIDPGKVEDVIRRVAETEVLPRFKNLAAGDIREKNPGDFVTVADEASEQMFSLLLPELLPGSLVVGEEAVAKDPTVLERLKGDKPVWVIDPIDGTYNFAHGRSKFGILIALVHRGVTEYGWAYDVPGNRMAFAKRGGGAFMDGKRLKISDAKTEMSALVGQGGGAQAWHFSPIAPLFREIVNVRCSLHDGLSFITGDADFIVHVNKVTPWDHAAVCLLAEEAGGYVALNDGKPYDPSLYGPAFMMMTPSRVWWEKLYPALYPKLARQRAS